MLLALAPLFFDSSTVQGEDVIFIIQCSDAETTSSSILSVQNNKDISSIQNNQTGVLLNSAQFLTLFNNGITQTDIQVSNKSIFSFVNNEITQIGILPKTTLVVYPISQINMLSQFAITPKVYNAITNFNNDEITVGSLTFKPSNKMVLGLNDLQAINSLIGCGAFVLNAIQLATNFQIQPKVVNSFSLNLHNAVTSVSLKPTPIGHADLNVININYLDNIQSHAVSKINVSNQLISQFNVPLFFVEFKCDPSSLNGTVNCSLKVNIKSSLSTNISLLSSLMPKVNTKANINRSDLQLLSMNIEQNAFSTLSFNNNTVMTTNVNLKANNFLQYHTDQLEGIVQINPNIFIKQNVVNNISTISNFDINVDTQYSILPNEATSQQSMLIVTDSSINVSNDFSSLVSVALSADNKWNLDKFVLNGVNNINIIPSVKMIQSFDLNSLITVGISYHAIIRHFSTIIDREMLHLGVIDRPVPLFYPIDRDIIQFEAIDRLIPINTNAVDRPTLSFKYKD